MRDLLLVMLPVLGFGVGLAAAGPPPRAEAEPAAGEIDALIRQLGDTSFAVRQAATERLLERPEAAPALRKALKSNDPEVARRAAAILEGYVRRQEKQALDRLADFAKNGELDLAIELFVRRAKWADEEAAWQVITGSAQQLIDLGEKEFGKPAIPQRRGPLQREDLLPAGDFRQFAEKFRPTFQFTGRVISHGRRPRQERVIARAEEIEAGDCLGDVLISAATVRSGTDKATRPCELLNCVVFAAGSVEAFRAYDSIIVCDDFTASFGVGRCLIVARGDVRCPEEGAPECRVITSGTVFLPGIASKRNTQVKENEANPLGFVKWFEPSSVGVVVEAAEGGLRLKEATEGKPFAKAGMRSGDLAVSADGKAIGSAEDFRRLLRRKVVMQEDLPLEVRRDGQLLKLVVSFKE